MFLRGALLVLAVVASAVSGMKRSIVSTPNAPGAIGPYSQGVVLTSKSGDVTVQAAGQIGIDPATGELVSGGITNETVRVMQNIEAITATYGLSAREWEGLDELPEEEEFAPSANNTFFHADTGADAGGADAGGAGAGGAGAGGAGANASGGVDHPPLFVVAGQYNTGTNLMYKLIKLNFPAASHYDQELRPGLPNIKTYFWKHTKPANMKPTVQAALKSSRVVAVVLIRDPLSWLQSMRKAPYDMARCVRRPGWLTARCATNPTYGEPYAAVPQKQVSLPSIQAHWTEWIKDYQHMTDYSFAGAVVVRYEDLVFDTEGQLARVGSLLQQPVPKPLKQLYTPAKTHGSPNGRAAALQKLRTKSYMQGYEAGQVDATCQRLDRELMHSLNYTDCPL